MLNFNFVNLHIYKYNNMLDVNLNLQGCMGYRKLYVHVCMKVYEY